MPDKIKIFFLIDELGIGGTERQVILISNSLPSDKFEIVIGVLRENQAHHKHFIYNRIVNFRWNGWPFIKNIALIEKLIRFLKKERFDIIQTHFPESEIHTAIALRFLKKKPVFIGTRRNLYHWIDTQPFNYFLYKLVSRWTDFILTNSFKVREICHKKERIPRNKLKVIQNAVEIDKYGKISKNTAKRLIGLNPSDFIIGIVANWRPVKGLKDFLKAASIVRQEIPDAHFVLAGIGSQKNELISLANHIGIYNKAHFLENYPDIPSLMSAFDIAVQSSISEGFSNVLIEYMASELPIVATNVGDAEIIIDNAKEGILIPPEDSDQLAKAIIDLAMDRGRARKMAIAANKKVAANWASEKILKEYQTFYESIAK
jgi:glycosyltransferase involved in cell wall biosynthesis